MKKLYMISLDLNYIDPIKIDRIKRLGDYMIINPTQYLVISHHKNAEEVYNLICAEKDKNFNTVIIGLPTDTKDLSYYGMFREDLWTWLKSKLK